MSMMTPRSRRGVSTPSSRVLRSAVRNAPGLIRGAGRVAKKVLRHVSRSRSGTSSSSSSRRGSRSSAGSKATEAATIDAGAHGGIGARHFTIKVGGGKHVKKSLGKFFLTSQFGPVIEGVEGQQKVDHLCALNTGSQILNSTVGGSIFDGTNNYFSLNPYCTNTGSALIPTVVQPLNDKIGLLSQHVKLDLTNHSNIGLSAQIYCMVAKKNHNKNYDVAWVEGLSADSFGLAQGTFGTVPVATYVPGTAGSANYIQVGQVPQTSTEFRKLWKILKVTRIDLAANASQELNYSLKFNKTLDRMSIKAISDSGNRYVSGLSVVFGIVMHGQVVIDTKAVGISGALSTFGTSRLASVVTIRNRFCAIAGGAARLGFQYGISNIVTGDLLTN